MTAPAALKIAAQQQATTLGYFWKISRVDGEVYGFTNINEDRTYGGVLYKAATGFLATNVNKTNNLASDNVNVQGPLDSVNASDITREDLFEGRLRGATLEIFKADYNDIANTIWTFFTGTIGEVTEKGNTFEVEVLALDHKLRQSIGRVIGPLCDAEFADARCGLAAGTFTFSGAVTAVTDNATFFDTVTPAITGKAADYFGAGVLTWTGGANAGLKADIKAFSGARKFTLYDPMPNDIQAGDTFDALAGCRLRRGADCRDKFDNVINHRGFPDIPGDKFLIRYAHPGA